MYLDATALYPPPAPRVGGRSSDSVSETSATTGGRRQATVERLFQPAGVEGRAGGLKILLRAAIWRALGADAAVALR